MRRLRKYIAVLLVFAGLYSIWWLLNSRKEMQGPQKGTAATVAELRKQIPLHKRLDDLPEIGPFHWEGPYSPRDPQEVVSNGYRIWGKAKDPMLLLKWMHFEEVEDKLNPDEVESLGYTVTTGCGIEIFSDGSYEIGQYEFDGYGYRDIPK